MADDNYTTTLSPADQAVYDKQYSPEDSEDYDMQGYFKSTGGAAPNTEGQHYPDTFKKPNHITFSDQSQYHGVDGNQGGSWDLLPDNTFTFTPGATNLANHSTQELIDYFQKYEPGNKLLLPGS